MEQILTVDYLVIGAGAMGMAFVDTVMTDNKEATFAIVDRYDRPGGHWNKAYPFVRLHQPSNFYGVNSKKLGDEGVDKIGWNSGLAELATSDEVLAYYTQVLRQQFLPSGRVAHYPLCEYTGIGRFHSIVTGQKYSVDKETRIIDATFMHVKVPSMGPPVYSVANDVKLVTPNDLAKISRPYTNYTIVGAGKTGIDACLWMLSMGIEPSKITWIMPRDSWLMDRSLFQPGEAFLKKALGSLKSEVEAVMTAASIDDLLLRLNASGNLLRLSDDVWPTMFRCATVSLAELEQVRKVEHVVRMGRVKQITAHEVILEGGSFHPVLDTIYIDCTADGLKHIAPVPVFNGNHITLQSVRTCQQVFSAAFIARVETAYDTDEKKNSLCAPIPHPNKPRDWFENKILERVNTVLWDAEPTIVAWLKECRLDFIGGVLPPLPEDPEQRRDKMQADQEMSAAYTSKIQKLLDEDEAGKAKA